MKKYLPIYLLLILGVLTRFLPHMANFTAIGAIALFGGIYLPKKWSVIAPLTIMFASDIFIGFYSWQIMAGVYLGFVIMGLIGIQVRKNKKFHTVLAGTLLGSIIFFLLTNLAVWMFGTMYAHNLSGLMQSYYMALPFFRNSLMGNLIYTAVLVGGYELFSIKIKQAVLAWNK